MGTDIYAHITLNINKLYYLIISLYAISLTNTITLFSVISLITVDVLADEVAYKHCPAMLNTRIEAPSAVSMNSVLSAE